MGLLSREDIEFMDDIDPFLYRKMIHDIEQGNYDFLHGALGTGTYFLSRFDKKETPRYLNELLTKLEDSGVSCEDGIKWISTLEHATNRKGYNICLSHGMASIAAFLVRLHELNFERERVDRLLVQTINYILNQITYTGISYFPTYAKESTTDSFYSRLAWCYGDLGIAHVLLQAASVLKNKEWESIAIKVLLNGTKRTKLEENLIYDGGICHGSAGVAHIYWNLYQRTKEQKFREASEYWLETTTQMAKYEDGLAGFKVWRKKDFGGPIKLDTLLEGASGIGLVFLSYMKGTTAWDECFMLS